MRELLAEDLTWYTPLSRNNLLNGMLRSVVTPGFLAVVLIRIQQSAHHRSPALGLLLRSVNFHVTGVESHVIHPIGPGLHLPHPTGIVLGNGVRIGSRVSIFQNVTIGTRTLFDKDAYEWPVLEDNCSIGAGACVLGDVTVGNGAIVGANAVAMKDVVPGGRVRGPSLA